MMLARISRREATENCVIKINLPSAKNFYSPEDPKFKYLY
jgi:hypothetical protein